MRRLAIALAVMVAVAISATALAGSPHLHQEKWYQERWASEHGGIMEVVAPNGTRCDIVTPTHAIEVDFAPKWAEAIGQALNYACQTGLQPGIVLVVESPGDRRFVEIARQVNACQGLGITIWEMNP